ncbi:MAG: hypothetical protein JSU09_12645 [Bacteroidetes bacterium]|nr:hypothetical protein [Bacteroidota bacterium]
MKTKIIGLIFLLLISADSFSQCAMCRAQLENNISNGNIGIAAGINFGILYLFAAPYLAISVIAFFWFRSSKRNALKLNKGNMAM